MEKVKELLEELGYEPYEIEDLLEAGITQNPKDYYFKVEHNPDHDPPVWAIIQPKKYFDTNGCWFDGHVTLDAGGLLDLDPDYCELCEGEVESSNESITLQAMQADLLARGFELNPKL